MTSQIDKFFAEREERMQALADRRTAEERRNEEIWQTWPGPRDALLLTLKGHAADCTRHGHAVEFGSDDEGRVVAFRITFAGDEKKGLNPPAHIVRFFPQRRGDELEVKVVCYKPPEVILSSECVALSDFGEETVVDAIGRLIRAWG